MQVQDDSSPDSHRSLSSSLSSTPTSPSSSPSSALSTSPPRTPPNLHQHTMLPSATWVVQKYGGTSVGKFATKIAEDIVPTYLDRHRLAIVCSARSGSSKALGTTNLLLRAASEAVPTSRSSSPSLLAGPSAHPHPSARRPFDASVDLLKSDHVTAAKQSVTDPLLLDELLAEIDRDCEALRGLLFAVQVIDEISPRSKDNIIRVGERLACKLVATVLRDRGIDAEPVFLENIVPEGLEDGEHASSEFDDWNAETLGQEFYDRLAIIIGERISQCGSRVPVIPGFFGPVPGSLLRQVGRGYTDLLAALVTVGLAASELQIWKEVDGFFTADPSKVATARVLSEISPDEAAELTYYGTEVIHPFAMEQVVRRKIPIHIKNVACPGVRGTAIRPEPDAATPPSPDGETLAHAGTSLTELGAAAEERRRRTRLPTAVTIKEHILVLNVNSNRKSVSHGFLARTFETLDRFGVVVDLISTSEVHVSMAIEAGVSRRALERLVRDLERNSTVTVHHDMAILSLVGHQMRNMVGIAGRMFTTLAEGNVNIEMISQGASEINISCVVEARDAVKALHLIHQSCLQIRPEGARGRVGPWLF